MPVRLPDRGRSSTVVPVTPKAKVKRPPGSPASAAFRAWRRLAPGALGPGDRTTVTDTATGNQRTYTNPEGSSNLRAGQTGRLSGSSPPASPTDAAALRSRSWGRFGSSCHPGIGDTPPAASGRERCLPTPRRWGVIELRHGEPDPGSERGSALVSKPDPCTNRQPRPRARIPRWRATLIGDLPL